MMNGERLMDLMHSKFGPNYSLVSVEAEQLDGCYVRILVKAPDAFGGYLMRIECDEIPVDDHPSFYVARKLDDEWQEDRITNKIEEHLVDAHKESIDFTPQPLSDFRDYAPDYEDDEPHTQDPQDVLEDLRSIQDDVREIQDQLTDLIEIVGGHRKPEPTIDNDDYMERIRDIIDRIIVENPIPYTSPDRNPWNPMPNKIMDGMQVRGDNWVLVDESEYIGFDWNGWFKGLTDIG